LAGKLLLIVQEALNMREELITQESIESRIFIIRGQKVMLDRDLAILYGVETRALKQAVKRNFKRFPEDFMFVLTDEELEAMVSQNVIPSMSYFGGASPFAFSEQGVSMLSTVLNSEKAILVNIAIMRAFVRLRRTMSANKEITRKLELLEKRVFKHDSDIRQLVRDIRKLTIEKSAKKLNVGFLK
jgi:hypothetical protein